MSKLPLRNLKLGLLLSAETEYGRGVLRGTADFAEDHPSCIFRVIEPDKSGIAAMEKWEPDGLVVMLNDKKLVPRVRAISKPTVYVCKPVNVENPACVQSDDQAVGRLGAEHLMELGAASYGFVGLAEGDWVKVRAESFQRAIMDAGFACTIFQPLDRVAGAKEQTMLAAWLKKSPKPLAVMACNDICGRFVLETIRQTRLRVPEDVAVVGVDNEEPLSRLVWPGLSSVSLNTDEIGYKAATMLHRMLTGPAATRTFVQVAPLGVVARGSTRPLANEDPVLSKIITVINESISRPLAVDDLAEMAATSRASLERRFRRVLNRTPLQEIRRARVARARQLLKATDLPLKAIASQCGYQAASRLIEAFQAEMGVTPNAYRSGSAANDRNKGARNP